MNIGQLFMALSNTPKDEETVLVCYVRSDVQEMLERDISREEWSTIVSEIEKTWSSSRLCGFEHGKCSVRHGITTSPDEGRTGCISMVEMV